MLGIFGRTSLSLGLLILLFVAYQLWGTGIHEKLAQDALDDEFEEALAAARQNPATPGGASSPNATAGSSPSPPPPTPTEGEPVARLRIPKIGLDKVVVEGVSVKDLKRGPGHYPGSPLPGQAGNASVAGHRTTYGAPFHRIDELVSGDEIAVTSLQGVSRYMVIQQLVVRPDQVEVLGNYGDNRLTLTACHPKYSAAERLVVIAKLQEEDADDVPEAPDPDVAAADVTLPDLDGGLSGESASVWPVAALGVACVLIWFGAWVMARFVKPVIAYAIGTPLFLIVLFVFYENVARLLPANF